MVTFLQVGFLGYFGVIFTFLLVFVIMYGFLSWTKPFGDNKGLYSIVALAFAVLAITSKGVMTLISFITPWFFIVIFVGFFILFMLMIFGLKQEQLKAGMSGELRTWIIVFTVVILLFGLGTAFGQSALESGTGGTPSTDDGSAENTDDGGTGTGTGNGGLGDPDKTATTDYDTNLLNTLVNPKVLGMAVVLLVGIFAMFLLTKGSID